MGLKVTMQLDTSGLELLLAPVAGTTHEPVAGGDLNVSQGGMRPGQNQ